MSTYIVGSRLLLTVPVIDILTNALVDPASFLFTLLPPSTSGLLSSTYAWNGAVWTVSESTIAVPARASLGTFTLRITIPYVNTAKGQWWAGWKTVANNGGFGEGANELQFVASKTSALP